jgi:DNA-binding response OmpR family regulator
VAKILIADDSPTQLIMYKMALRKAGHEVVTASNGIEGINQAYSELPDVIVSDIIMPEINGYVLCRLLKNDQHMARIPVILLSSLGQQHDKFWGLEAGADAYLVKAADTTELTEEISRQLEKNPATGAVARVIASDNEDGDLSSRVYQILDSLLFEHTVSNKVREIFKYAYNSAQLFGTFFDLLNSLVEYSMAGIALKMEHESFLTFDARQEVGKDELERLMKRNLKGENVADYSIEIFNRDKINKQGSGQKLVSELVEPILFNNQWRGFISVHSNRTAFFNEQTERILRISAKELANLIQFIAKMKEADALKADFASMVVYDLNKPLSGSLEILDALLNSDFGKKLDKDAIENISAAAKEISKALSISENISQTIHRVYEDKI